MTTNPRPDHPLDPHLAALRRDLTTITTDLRWAHTDAWWPTTLDRDAPRATTVVSPIRDTNPDQIPGPKYALGVGDDRTRTALTTVIEHLRSIEIRTAAAVHLTGRHPQQPAVVQPDTHASLEHLDLTIRHISCRLDTLTIDGPHLAHAELAAVRHQLRHAAGRADTAARVLTKALNRGDTRGLAHAEPKCRICGIREQATREHQVKDANGDRRTVKRASRGGRCHTCSNWFLRNGTERPRTLDGIDDALAAARRRATRHEGWGAA
ncbi:MAG: hypothetical protein JWN67_5023 [Actinomycetia bacterium]|nr:hypothetical protein [Actinomycetes bacterium]